MLRGRVASLLEVGTGFHPELTGQENIFLNGAILGMSRKEIARKFDEIVEFPEVERFLDTPVKHCSSGMYVRLAFAVVIGCIEIKHKPFIEFGVQDFFESNCRFLLMKDNWIGFVIDSSPNNIERLIHSYFYWKYQFWAPRKIGATHPTSQNCRQMIPLRSRSDSWTFTPEPHAIRMESNFSRCPII
jgi:hypothetical protein